MPNLALVLSKSTKGSSRFIVLIWRTNQYQQYVCIHNKCTAEEFGIYPRCLYFGAETSYWVLPQHPNRPKFIPSRRSKLGLLRSKQRLCLRTTPTDSYTKLEYKISITVIFLPFVSKIWKIILCVFACLRARARVCMCTCLWVCMFFF